MSIEEITGKSLSPRCMRCMLDKYLDAYPDDTPWDVRADYMRKVLHTVGEGSLTMTAPEISDHLSGVLREMFGITRDYAQVKWHFNELVLGLEDQVRQRIVTSDDPLGLAIRCAIVGNLIDFGPTGNVSEELLLQLVADADGMELDESAVSDLKNRIASACTVAYLMDNCGEIVFDKLLIEQIMRVNPGVRVTAVVRGYPTSNDATMEDAQQVGLDAVAHVIGNGSDVAGTVPSLVNEETQAVLKDSDLVISKGLANYETLSGRGANICFLFLCKCQLYVDLFEVPLHTGLVVRGV